MSELSELRNANGDVVARYTSSLQEVPTDDEALLEGLPAAGAVVQRDASTYTRTFAHTDTTVPALPCGFAYAPITQSPLELGRLAVQAYPCGHPDCETVDPAVAGPSALSLCWARFGNCAR